MSLLSPAGARILAAEDDPAILELVVTRLEIAGYRVACARDGSDAWRQLRANLPAAVILDVNMPRMDGFEVLNSLRAHPAGARLPVMMLTARKSAEDVRRARELGANDYLAKPFGDRDLLARVARLVKARGRAPAPALAHSCEDGSLLL